ncbi:bifunctional DedA family/phosphatase PAP2 family protein [Candidatus Nomurabacteria bacterium]|nr:bifunctional DedA family/phosphatase PAP2 family protein [Candidatus Nomurabacteria bacterium]
MFDQITNLLMPFVGKWGYLMVAIAAFLEVLPLFGAFIPGSFIMVAAGFLFRSAGLHISYLILVATLAGLIGDFTGYFLGRKYGEPLLLKYGKYMFLSKEKLYQAESVVKKYSGASIIIGRFNSFTRSIAPFIAGYLKITLGTFSFYNTIACFLWSAICIWGGYIFGRGYEAASSTFNQYFLAIAIIAVISFYLHRFSSKRNWIFTPKDAYLAFFSMFSLFFFVRLLEKVVHGRYDFLNTLIDQKIFNWLNPAIYKVMIFITGIVDPIPMTIFIIIISSILFYKKKLKEIFILLLSVVLSISSELIIKALTHIQRPAENLIYAYGFSFPSYHALMATVIFAVLIYSFWDLCKSNLQKILLSSISIAIIILISFSRLYLHAHWLSDVLAGISLGFFVVSFFILIFDLTAKNKSKIPV